MGELYRDVIMNKILLIGNSGLKHNGKDGQTVKVRIYLKKIKDEGYPFCFVDLENFLRHPFSVLHKIKKEIANCDRIVLLTAERGCKILIPFINRVNKRHNKPFILPLIGIGILHSELNKNKGSNVDNIIELQEQNKIVVSRKNAKNLRKITYILPETEKICDVYKKIYGLSNVYCLNNFREVSNIVKKPSNDKKELHLVYLSRVWSQKGIFDLIDVVKKINDTEKIVSLDIYGPKTFSDLENQIFNSTLEEHNEITYKGVIEETSVIQTLASYDLFVFPTKYYGEGTPGVISESLIAGTPILSSNFYQAHELLKDGFDSILFAMNDKEDLKEKLLYIINNKLVLNKMSLNALKSGEKFTYNCERNKFLKYICGTEE